MKVKIPLAWLQLTRETTRLLVAIAGISFADILIFMQVGFRDALFDSSVKLHSNLHGDVFLVSTQSTCLIAMKSFSHRRLYQALSFPEVASVNPVYIGFGLWKNPDPKKRENKVECKNNPVLPIARKEEKKLECPNTRQLMVIGFNPKESILDIDEIKNNLDLIKLSDIALVDRNSRPEFGPIDEMFKSGQPVETEVENRHIKVKGLFSLGASFGADGNLVTSDINFLRIFGNRRKYGLIDIGVINLKPGTDIATTVKKMRDSLPKDIFVLSKKEFVAFEKKYWQESTAIGFVFSLGAAMGFIVGIVIVYQILYTDVADHLPEYATLKAMGYTDLYFLGVVFQEALILAVVGYIPGFFVASWLFNVVRVATSLPMIMTVSKAVTVLGLTVLMCCASGAIAVRKLSDADPADIF